MNVQALKTHKIMPPAQSLVSVLDAYLTQFTDGCILVVTSKIVALCEGSVVPVGAADQETLIEQEADYFLPPTTNRYHVALTIKQGLLIPNAGIDESNGAGYHVLWPREPQQTANALCAYLRQRFNVQRAGVIISDSHVTPLRMGVTGVALAHSGFCALKDYVGALDLFDRPLRMTRANVADSLAAAAVLLMGEGNEQTPLAVIDDLPFVTFQDRDPTADELQQLRIAIEDDLYGPLLTQVQWRTGQSKG